MVPTMRPCPACERHVKTTDASCPFCAQALPEGFSAFVYPTTNKRLSRAAIAAFGAISASLALTACGASTSPADSGVGNDAQGPQDAQSTPDVSVAAYGIAPPYGLPPRDE